MIKDLQDKQAYYAEKSKTKTEEQQNETGNMLSRFRNEIREQYVQLHDYEGAIQDIVAIMGRLKPLEDTSMKHEKDI